MSAKFLLINPARHFIANKVGLGYLTPLGLVLSDTIRFVKRFGASKLTGGFAMLNDSPFVKC